MNDYRITYISETGEESNVHVIERTEFSARKAFSSAHKGMNLTIQNIELYKMCTCATKQQERDTLAAIKKMVEELGPQSYLATAFEGCFEDAESNIENDFGDSYKRRCESAEEKLSAAQEEINRLKKQIERMELDNRNLRIAIERVKKENSETITALREQALSPDDLETASKLLAKTVINLGAEVSNAAERIVEAAGEPESAAFKNAVNDHRAAQAELRCYTALLSRVNTLRKAD